MSKLKNNFEERAKALKLSGPSRRVMMTLDNLSLTSQLLGNKDTTELRNSFIELFSRYEKSYGLRAAILICKAFFNESTRYSCSLPVEPLTKVWLKRDRHNMPTVLKPFLSTLRGSNIDRRMALSILKSYECLELPVVPDLETITSPSSGRSGFASIQIPWDNFLKNGKFIHRLKKMYQGQIGQQPKGGPTRLHFSTKKGIKGPTATTAGLQSLAIVGDMKENLINFRSIFTSEDWREVLEDNQSYHLDHDDLTNNGDRELLSTVMGKISFIPDGIKTRTIAVGNYFLQDAFKQLHRVAYFMLGKLETDGTFDQTSQFERVRQASSRTGVWSFDLTAATDRFPLEPQVSVLKELHKRTGDLWERILRETSFSYEGQLYKYSVGQPMGLYSSWAIFSLTHHVVIQYCAYLERVTYPFEDYAVLGDDVAIWHPGVAKRYREILTLFDVKISEQKSFIPEFPDKPCVAEFAKRFSDKGIEFGPISPDQNNNAWENYYDFPAFLDWLANHGIRLEEIPVSRISDLMGLTPHQTGNFLCSLKVWEYLRGPLGLTFDVPEEYRSYINQNNLVRIRIKLLLEQTARINIYIDPSRAALENRLSGPIPNNHYFLLILKARLRDLWELTNRLLFSLPLFEEELIDDGYGPKWPGLSEIEYLPFSEFESLLSQITTTVDKKTLKGRYIQSLLKAARSYKKLGKATPFEDPLYGDSTYIIGPDGPEDGEY